MADDKHQLEVENPSDKVIVALDKMTWNQATETLEEVGPYVGMGKTNSLSQRRGIDYATRAIGRLGALTMIDHKYHDIPETVMLEVEEAVHGGAAMLTVHASGGQPMLEAAVAGRKEAGDYLAYVDDGDKIVKRVGVTAVLAITVLTSLDTNECKSIYGDEPEKKVIEFARMAADAGIDGIVCSPLELRAIRSVSALDGLKIVTPGITPVWAKKAHDQRRVATPRSAIDDGADNIVIGRAITQPPEGITRPEAAQRVVSEIS